MSPTHQDLSNDTTFSQLKSRVPVPLTFFTLIMNYYYYHSFVLLLEIHVNLTLVNLIDKV